MPAFVFALFSGAALTVAMWRTRLRPGATVTAADWAVGLGFGLGVALGPVIALSTSLDRGVAPDSWHTGTFIVLAIWVLLITFLFVSVPAWIGRWADAWQRDDRVSARGAMTVAAAGAWVTLAIGLDLVLSQFTSVEAYSVSTKLVLEQTWTTFGYDAARTTDAWVICLVFIAVPLAGYLASLRRRPARVVGETAPRPLAWLGRGRPAALACLAGLAAVIAVTLVTAAVARARIAPAIRWNGMYFAQFIQFEEQMVILVAVIVALVAAAILTDELSDTIAIVVGGVIGALSILAISATLTLGSCAAPFSPTYNHPPANDCPGYPGWLAPDIFPAAIEAALIAILLIPAAHYGGILIARRARLGARRRWGARTVRWLAAGLAAAAVIAGIAVRVPDASAHGVQPIGAIGQDGWVNGPGYQIRLFPNWYQITRNVGPGDVLLEYGASASGLPGWLAASAKAVSPKTIVRAPGRLVLLDGARTLQEVSPDYKGNFYMQWITLHDNIEYIIDFQTIPSDYPSLSADLNAMITSWRWNSTAS